MVVLYMPETFFRVDYYMSYWRFKTPCTLLHKHVSMTTVIALQARLAWKYCPIYFVMNVSAVHRFTDLTVSSTSSVNKYICKEGGGGGRMVLVFVPSNVSIANELEEVNKDSTL